ncbi:LOW QUALITY PROTEIN: hypothetical protein HID58_071048, partial [Brassica napus]
MAFAQICFSQLSPPPPPRLFHFIFSPPPPSSDAIDRAPLLLSGDENEGSNSNGGGEQQRSSSVRRPGLREATRLLSRASSSGGRAMREPSMVVREAAAEQLEERQSDWAYSEPIVVLDIVWNLAFVSVAGDILVMVRNEHPIMPLRVWLLGRRNRVRNNRTPRSRSSSSSSSMEEDALGSSRNSHEEMDSPVNFIPSLLTVVKTFTTFFEKNDIDLVTEPKHIIIEFLSTTILILEVPVKKNIKNSQK